MAMFDEFLRSLIARKAEAMMRRFGQLTVQILRDVTRRILGGMRRDSGIKFNDIYPLVRAVANGIEYARDMWDSGQTPRRIVPADPTIPATAPQYRYRVVIAVENEDGEEQFSTAVNVESSTPLTPTEIRAGAKAMFDQAVGESAKYQLEIEQVEGRASTRYYLVHAGRAQL